MLVFLAQTKSNYFQLLTRICVAVDKGHSTVSEALSTLRLRFGEPVRFRFLVGMLTSTGGQGELLSSGLKFLNAFMDSSGCTQKRLYIQAELQQAGLEIESVKKVTVLQGVLVIIKTQKFIEFHVTITRKNVFLFNFKCTKIIASILF